MADASDRFAAAAAELDIEVAPETHPEGIRTAPFGHPRSLDTYLDPTLTEFDEIWAAAGTPRDVFPLTPDDLRRAGAQEIGDFTAPLA